MVKTYADLFLDARRALLKQEGQFAANARANWSAPPLENLPSRSFQTVSFTPLRRFVS